MKNLFFALAFILIGTSSFAMNNSEKNSSEETSVIKTEVEYITIDSRCYVRWCWLEGTKKVCTAWNEVPCDKGLKEEAVISE